jgi:hypothetical protein
MTFWAAPARLQIVIGAVDWFLRDEYWTLEGGKNE